MNKDLPLLEVLVGAYTVEDNEGITLFHFNIENGDIESKGLVATTVNPSYLTISKNREYVFTVNETENGGVSSFKWNNDRSKLELISEELSQGDYPCYAELSNDESLFAISNYITGNVLVYDIDGSGVIQKDPFINQHSGQGPNTDRQEGPHAHCTKFSPYSDHMYAVDLGIDEIVKYELNGKTIGNSSTAFKLKPGDGPRHLIFHKTKRLAFVINELSSTIISLNVEGNGDFTEVSRVSTLPDDFEGDNSCADIHISDDGKFLYGSNRGHNSIVIISVAEDGALTKIAHESVRGDWPRGFTLSPDMDNKFMLVANEKSNNIVVFSRDGQTGYLTYTGKEVKISQPVCLKF